MIRSSLPLVLGILTLREPSGDSVFPIKVQEGMSSGSPLYAPCRFRCIAAHGHSSNTCSSKDPADALVLSGRIAELPGEVINCPKEIIPSPEGGLSLEQRQPFWVDVKHLSGIILALVRAFSQASISDKHIQAAESSFYVLVDRKMMLPAVSDDIVTGDMIGLGQYTDLVPLTMIDSINLLRCRGSKRVHLSITMESPPLTSFGRKSRKCN